MPISRTIVSHFPLQNQNRPKFKFAQPFNLQPSRLVRQYRYILKKKKNKIKDVVVKSSFACSSNIITEVSCDTNHNILDFNYLNYLHHCIITWLMSTFICFSFETIFQKFIDNDNSFK